MLMKSSGQALRPFAAAAICIFLLSSLADRAAAAPDYRFHAQTVSLLNEIKDTLVKHKLCVDRERCSNQQIVFASPESWGIAVELYGVEDMAVLQELTASISAAFFRADAAMSMELKVYSSTKEQALRAPMFRKPKPTREIRWENRHADR